MTSLQAGSGDVRAAGGGGTRLAVVCPMANEIGTAERFVREVLTVCKGLAAISEVRFFAVLDRMARDGTLECLRALEASVPELQVIYAPENRCVVDAYLRGHREALASGADWVLEIDAGYSHQPGEIPRFILAINDGADCVFGSRFIEGGVYEGGPGRRYWISRGGGMLSRALLGSPLSDLTSGFQMFRRHALEHVLACGVMSRGPFFQTEMKLHAHVFRMAEVPITYVPTSQGISRPAIGDALKVLWHLFMRRVSGGRRMAM